MKSFFLLCLPVILSACASVHPGRMAASLSEQKQIPLRISAETLEGGKNEGYQMIQFTIENPTAEWIRLDSIEILPDPKGAINVVLGEDLQQWTEAWTYKKHVDETNEGAVALGVYGVGLLAVAAAGGDTAKLAGAGTMVGATGYMAGTEISRGVAAAEQSEKVPSTHLFAKTLVPAKMFQRRWLLVRKPVGDIVNTIAFSLKTEEGRAETFAVRLY